MLVLRKEDTYSGRVVRTQGLIHVPAALGVGAEHSRYCERECSCTKPLQLNRFTVHDVRPHSLMLMAPMFCVDGQHVCCVLPALYTCVNGNDAFAALEQLSFPAAHCGFYIT